MRSYHTYIYCVPGRVIKALSILISFIFLKSLIREKQLLLLHYYRQH